MKLNMLTAVSGYQTVINFESDHYDAITPIDHIFIENRLRFANADRLAIACALLLKDYTSTQIEFPKPCSPEVAIGIEKFFLPLQVRVMNVDYKPFAKPIGARTVFLKTSDTPKQVNKYFDLEFGLTDNNTFSSLLGIQEILLASNIRLLASANQSSIAFSLLGLCILFAEDFCVSRIILSDSTMHQIFNFGELQNLANLANIELVSADV